MDVVSQTPVTLWVDFLTATDDLVVPDTGTAMYAIHDGGGVKIVGPLQLEPTAGATGVSVSIPDTINTIAPSKLFDIRTVVVSWMANGASGAARRSYRLIPFPNHRVDGTTVRNVIGIASDELPDADIDVFTGYLLAAGKLGENGFAALDGALAAGNASTVVAERLIAYITVLEMVPALQQRILQKKEDGTLKNERLKGIDVAALAAGLAARVGLDVDSLLGTATDQLGTSTIMVLTTPTTDPVTGAAPEVL